MPTYRTLTVGDPTWRFRGRGTPSGHHESIDGRDCYWFQRDGGEKPTDKWTINIIPVEKFWGASGPSVVTP